jgi:formylglycine-generating enzyme
MPAKRPALLILCGALFAQSALANVFNMAPGLTNLQFVTVGNPGNAPDTRYNDISVGSVDHVYQIGKYEITAGQYTEFLNAVAKVDPNGLYQNPMGSFYFAGTNIQRSGSSPNFSYSVAADWANLPMSNVSFWDAARFVNWLSNGQPTGPQGPATTEGGAYHDVGDTFLFGRNPGAKFFIPTEDEWYKAAYHNKSAGLAASYFDYPTSSNVNGIPHNTLPDPGNHANYYDTYFPGNIGYTVGDPYYRTQVGEFINSPSPYGTFDQGGNVFEWNEATNSYFRGTRGGSFYNGLGYLFAGDREFLDPRGGYVNVGFRVASLIPEPSSAALCVVGAALMLWIRTKQFWQSH